MKLFYLAYIIGLLFFFSCTTEVVDNQRILIEGRVIDENGNGLENINVKSETFSFLLGEGKSDTDGNFSFTSLKTNRNEITITINQRQDQINTPLNSIIFLYKDQAVEQTYELGDVILRDTAILDLNIEKSSTTAIELTWQLLFINGSCERIFFGQEQPGQNLCYEENLFAAENNSERPDFTQQFLTIKNTEAIFRYRIDQGMEQIITIPINEEFTSYVFEF